MKKLILLLIAFASISAQEIQFGVNLSTKFASTEKTITGYGFWGDPRIRKEGGNFTGYSFSVDLTADFNKYIAIISELGYTGSGDEYDGIDAGLYYSTNKLHDFVYLKSGFYVHINIPENPRANSRTIFISSLGAGIRILKHLYIEGAYQIPITKSYVKEDAIQLHSEVNKIYYIGMKIVY